MTISSKVRRAFGQAGTYLGLLGLTLFPAVSEGGVIWRSDFETVNSTPVAHGQAADPDTEPDPDPRTAPEPDAVDNTGTGFAFGEADGSQEPFAVTPAYLYKKYNQGGVPPIPGAIDPSGAAGTTAFWFADEHRAALNTELPTGNVSGLPYNLNLATTVEGYFSTAYTDVINYETTVPVRIYSDMRSYNDGSIRFAVGLSNYQPPAAPGLHNYEGFDYTGGLLPGNSGGVGWKEGSEWVLTTSGESAAAVAATLATSEPGLNFDGLNFAAPLAKPAAAGTKVQFGGGGGPGVGERLMNASYDMGQEGVFWVSCLMRKTGTSATGSEAVYLRFFDNIYNLRLLIAISSSERMSLAVGGGTQLNSSPAIINGRTYFVVVRVVSHVSPTADEGAMWVFDANATTGFNGNTIPATEAALLAMPPVHLGAASARADGYATGGTNAILDRMHVRVDQNNNLGEIDEIRIGSSYQSVVDAAAPVGGSLPPYNVLGISYVTSGGSTVVHYGTTPVLGNTWYHFAAVYDGTSPTAANRTIKAYLNGQEEISVSNVSMIAGGTAPLLIGNDRFQAEINSRNYNGMLDEIRVYDAALTPQQMMFNGPPHSDNLVWASSFETENGQPVAHDQAPASGVAVEAGDLRRGFVSAIDNSASRTGMLPGYVTKPDSLLYLHYGQAGVTAAPPEIDVLSNSGAAALYFPVERSGRIDTNTPSNSGNLASRLTFSTLFNSWDPTIQTATTTLGRRLFSQMNSATVTRLGLGLHRSATGNVLAVLYRSNGAHQEHGEASATQDHVLLDDINITPHQWYQAKLVFDGTTVRAYLNGQKRIEFQPVDLAAASGDSLLIGNAVFTQSNSHGFYGLLDQVQVLDEARVCATPFADADEDGDVDQEDFGALQLCFTGASGNLAAGCECFDQPPTDGHVDSADVTAFIKCVSGPEIPWSLALTPGCIP